MKDKVIEIISNSLEISKDDIKLDSDLITDLEVESLDLVDLIVAFEREFNIEIQDNDIKDLHTVKDIIDYIENNV